MRTFGVSRTSPPQTHRICGIGSAFLQGEAICGEALAFEDCRTAAEGHRGDREDHFVHTVGGQ